MSTDLARATKEALAGNLEELLAAVKELAAPLSEEQFWRKPVDPGNSFGHLVLHLALRLPSSLHLVQHGEHAEQRPQEDGDPAGDQAEVDVRERQGADNANQRH